MLTRRGTMSRKKQREGRLLMIKERYRKLILEPRSLAETELEPEFDYEDDFELN